jgi:hypothetical protein
MGADKLGGLLHLGAKKKAAAAKKPKETLLPDRPESHTFCKHRFSPRAIHFDSSRPGPQSIHGQRPVGRDLSAAFPEQRASVYLP